MNVLVVEDNALNRLLITELLEPAGYQIREAVTLKEARRLLSEERPRLILMDMNLPDGHGLELVREVRADDALRQVPIAALSANAMQSDQAEALDAGCDAYLTKPLNHRQLLEEVARLIGERGAA